VVAGNGARELDEARETVGEELETKHDCSTSAPSPGGEPPRTLQEKGEIR